MAAPAARIRSLSVALLAAAAISALLFARPSRRAAAEPDASARTTARGVSGTSARAPSPAPAPRPAQIDTVLRATYGSAPGQLGRTRPIEGAPEGPMSFAVDAEGRAFVLDQVNARVQVFAPGKPPEIVPIPADTYQDLDLLPGGGFVLLDRLARGAVAYFRGGKLTHEVPIAGRGVPEPGGVTGVFARADGVWVEVEHRAVVRVAGVSGAPDPDRPRVPGRFSADGTRLLRAVLAGDDGATVLATPASTPLATPTRLATVRFAGRVQHLLALESDPAGRVVIAADVLEERSAPPFDVLREERVFVTLAADGAELSRASAPVRPTPEEQLRTVRLGADGAIYVLDAGEAEATLGRVSP